MAGGIDFEGGADADLFVFSDGSSATNIDFEGDVGADVFIVSGEVLDNIDFSGGADADFFSFTGSWVHRFRR